MRRANKLGWVAFGLWGVGVVMLVGLVGAVGVGWVRNRTTVAEKPDTAPPIPAVIPALPNIPSDTPPPTVTPTHTQTALATTTRAPSSTPTPHLSPTPTATLSNPLVIGYSVAGRLLEVFHFGSGGVTRMIVAGIHGGYEWNTIALADELIAYLNDHPQRIPPDVTLYILRALNPDGEVRVRGVNGRVNDNGVDLNRNWDSRWQADWPRDGCWKYTPVTAGTGPGSEPETQALMAFLLSANVDALLNYHSAVLGIFPGGQPPDPASINLAEAAAAVSTYPYPPIDTGCQYTGQLIDWASDNGIAALDIELTNHRDTDFEMNLRILDVFLNWRR